MRDKIKKLLQLYVTKRNKEECSSGISQEDREFDDLLQEINEQKNESEASYRHQHQLTVIRKGRANKQGKGGCRGYANKIFSKALQNSQKGSSG